MTSSAFASVHRFAVHAPRGSSDPVMRKACSMQPMISLTVDFLSQLCMLLAMLSLSQLLHSRAGQGAGSANSGHDVSPQLVLAIVCAGVVLASLDLFIVNVALPQVGRDFHLRGGALGDLSWVLNAYAIVYAALLVLFGRLAERYRRERGFLLGVAIFVGASPGGGSPLGGDRRPVGHSWSGGGGPARRGELAVGVPGQRAGRAAGAGHR